MIKFLQLFLFNIFILINQLKTLELKFQIKENEIFLLCDSNLCFTKSNEERNKFFHIV